MSTLSLRIWLTIIGVVIVAVVFFLNHKKRKSQYKYNRKQNLAKKRYYDSEESHDSLDNNINDHQLDYSDTNPLAQPQVKKAATNKSFTIIYLQYKDTLFPGTRLINALQDQGLVFGDMNIFHYQEASSKRTLFSVANAVAPGSLIPEDMSTSQTPSISLFFPTLSDNLASTFNIMLDIAQNLAIILDAKLLDDERNLMTEQTIGHYREKLINLSRLNQLNA